MGGGGGVRVCNYIHTLCCHVNISIIHDVERERKKRKLKKENRSNPDGARDAQRSSLRRPRAGRRWMH